MSNTSELYEFLVKVAGGSGCLFQPETDEYTYVLTAKHVLEKHFEENEKLIDVTRQLESGNQTLKVIGRPYFLENSDNDAAIIKIEFIKELYSLKRIDKPEAYEDLIFYLIGHPDTRRSYDVSYRPDRIRDILPKPNRYFEAAVPDPSNKEEIDGMSGGGVIGVKNNEYFLLGIQKGMSVERKKELFARIEFMPLSFFDEVTTQYSDELMPIQSHNVFDSQLLTHYQEWLSSSNKTFLVPVLDLRVPISLAWEEVFLNSAEFPMEDQSITQQINRYHKWESLAHQMRRDSKIYSATDLTINQKHLVVTAGPGSGKSTLTKKISVYLTTQSYIVLKVSLPLMTHLLKEGVTFDNALRESAFSNSGIDEESANIIINRADFLIADGLDECDPDRVVIANNLLSWSNGHPKCRIWVMTRAVGHTKNLLPNFNHLELLPLEDEAIENISEKFIWAKISDNERRSILHSEFISLVTRLRGENQIASIAARNPLLLSFLLALFLEGKPLNGCRANLFSQIITLIQRNPISERISTTTISSAIAERVAECAGWQLISNPSINRETLISQITHDLQKQTDYSRIQAKQLVEQSILFWEERQLLERLKIGSFEAYTFVHLSLAEYLAGRFIAGLSDGELSHFIEINRNDSRWRQPILLASGVGSVDRIVMNLLKWDQPDSPTSTEAILAAFAINESEMTGELVTKVIEHLQKRLTSSIPLLAIEAGEGLQLLARFAPDFVAKSTINLLNHNQEWTRLAAFTACISAGSEYATLSQTLKWLDDLKFVRRIFYTQESAETQIQDLPEEAYKLQESVFPKAIDKIFTELERDEAKEKVRTYLKKLEDNYTIELIEKLESVLGHYDSEELLEEAINEAKENIHVHIVRTADDETRIKGAYEENPDISIIESIIVAAEETLEQDLKSFSAEPSQIELSQLFLLTGGLNLINTGVTNYRSLSYPEKINAFREILRAAMIALKLDKDKLLYEATDVLAKLRGNDEIRLWEIIREVPVEVDWTKLNAASIDIARIAEALDHPSNVIQIAAAKILLTGFGGKAVLPFVKQVFDSAYQNSTFKVIAYIADKLWTTEEAALILLERLENSFSPGFQNIYLALAELWQHVEQDLQRQIVLTIFDGIRFNDPFIVSGAARALLKFQLNEHPFTIGLLKAAYNYWTENNDDTKQSPRALILKNLIRLNACNFDELIHISEDIHPEISKIGFEAIKKRINNDQDLMVDLLNSIKDGLDPFKSSTALNLLRLLLKLPHTQLKVVETTLLDVSQFKIPAIRGEIVSLLSSDLVSLETALITAQNSLNDSNPGVRNTAVKIIRLLNATPNSEGARKFIKN